MTSLENILFYYNCLEEKNSSKGILRQMLQHIRELKDMGIQELAEACYTSPSTISRIVKTLGYRDYHEFRSSVSNCVRQYSYHNRFCGESLTAGQDMKSLVSEHIGSLLTEYENRADLQELSAIADAMHNANSITIFSYCIFFMENVLQSDLILSGKHCEISCGDYIQQSYASQLKEGDFAIFFCPDAIDSISPLEHTIEEAKKQGATICVLTSSNRPSFQRYADYLVQYPGTHYMVDSFYLQFILITLDMCYRAKYLDGGKV